MDAQRNPNSMRRNPSSRTKETERPPFSDVSNFNLTPIETLRKPCCSTTTTTSASAAAAFLSNRTYSESRRTVSKPPISISGSDSRSSKPYNDNSTDSKSETSVGSSSFIHARNRNVSRISAPVRVPNPSRSSPTTSASRDGELATYGKRGITRKSNGEKEAIVLPCSSTLLENKRGKTGVVADPIISQPPRSNKKEKVTGKSFNCLHSENKKDETEVATKLVSSLHSSGNKDKGKGIVENVCLLPAKNKKDKGKSIAENVSLLPVKNKKDRGKEILESLSSPPRKNNNGGGNAILSVSNSLENKNKGTDILEHAIFLSTEKRKNKGKENFESLSSPPSKTKKDGGNTTVNIGSSHEKTMAKDISDLSLKSSPSRKTRGKRKSDKLVFSCPPLPKTRNSRDEFNEAGDVGSSGSWTDPSTKRTKKRHSGKQMDTEYMWPKDFIEQQKAYFKEIDEFDLPEEEPSDDDCYNVKQDKSQA